MRAKRAAREARDENVPAKRADFLDCGYLNRKLKWKVILVINLYEVMHAYKILNQRSLPKVSERNSNRAIPKFVFEPIQ